ncbi:hypothetical protein [Haloglomus litoreum]|uniref:hypothetical protein n=1 Tax=Haloglomus litoreum TaxID=3034026 RepID=UPI0023E7C708|nr:hypothetical protein [Haloglomus sp. DT116]
MDGPDGPLDVPTLRTLGQRSASHPLVDGWRLEPAVSPRKLVVDLDPGSYPAGVSAARIDARWFDSGDYSVHYVETRADTEWQCRWDRHAKPSAPRAHVHPPPDAGVAEPSPLEAHDPLGVWFAILDWIREHVATLFEELDEG